jgi:dTDP-4-dehydrorhamnose reductase
MIEIWGGMECTINRVGNDYFDQLAYSEHYNRMGDIDRFAELGIRKMRYPVLWEKHKPDEHVPIDWTWVEHKLLQLKANNIQPIAGLVHHGSGPLYVNMLDDSFVYGLATYAGQVAERFPWIEYYTPVNEPLTTARFCGLYGLWYPHKADDQCFIRILVNECKATILAMQEIRKINPHAKLVQTEDLGMIHSTPTLQYQADFENHRRWLSLDLLCGKVTTDHTLFRYLIESGITAEELSFFTKNPCPPDVCGFNYYPTSERYLDEDIYKYPAHTHGSNNQHQYADVEVLRVGNAEAVGLNYLLKEAWRRYHLPLAVTEVHLHCTREEQLRWLNGIWETACQLKSENVNIVAITAWALLGSFGWNKLLTQPNGDYEPGVFDILSGKLRITAIGQLLKELSAGVAPTHPLITEQGWWERELRVIYNRELFYAIEQVKPSCNPLLIIGDTSLLVCALAKVCLERNINYQIVSGGDIDFSEADQISHFVQELKPWAIINTIDYLVGNEHTELEREKCHYLNANLPKKLSQLSSKHGVKLVTFSTVRVFDGSKETAYLENDAINPVNVYAQSKAQGEQCVLQNDASALIIRTGALFSPWDNNNDAGCLIDNLKYQLLSSGASPEMISPTYVPDLVHTCLNLLIDNESGIWHLANSGTITRARFADQIARSIDHSVYHVIQQKKSGTKNATLQSTRGALLPPLTDALNRFYEDIKSMVCEYS